MRADVGEQHGLVGCGCLWIDDGGQLLVLDVDQLGGVDGGRLGLGEDRHDRLAHIEHPVDGDEGAPHLLGKHGQHVRRGAHVGHVCSGEHPDNAWRRACVGHVEPGDQPVAHRGPEVGEVNGVVEFQIVDVGAAGSQEGGVFPSDDGVAENAHRAAKASPRGATSAGEYGPRMLKMI